MADGGPWLMSLGGGCTLVFETDARRKTTMEGEREIPLSLQVQNRTKSRYFTIHVGIISNIVSGPLAQPDQNNTQIILYGVTLKGGINVYQEFR